MTASLDASMRREHALTARAWTALVKECVEAVESWTPVPQPLVGRIVERIYSGRVRDVQDAATPLVTLLARLAVRSGRGTTKRKAVMLLAGFKVVAIDVPADVLAACAREVQRELVAGRRNVGWLLAGHALGLPGPLPAPGDPSDTTEERLTRFLVARARGDRKAWPTLLSVFRSESLLIDDQLCVLCAAAVAGQQVVGDLWPLPWGQPERHPSSASPPVARERVARGSDRPRATRNVEAGTDAAELQEGSLPLVVSYRESTMSSTSPRPPGQVFTNEPTGPITRLRVVGRPIEFDLRDLPDPDRFTIGRVSRPGDVARADLQLDEPLVSLVHAELERRGDRLWYTDRNSTNGTYLRNDREQEFVVRRGLLIRVAEPTLLALDELLVTLRDRLAWSMGLDDAHGVDHALARIVDDQPVLLIGPPGCEQAALAQAIHDTSGRRGYPFVSMTGTLGSDAEERLDEARWGTVFVDLHAAGKVTQGFARTLLGGDKPTLHLRPIIAGPDLQRCQTVLGQLARAQLITLPPLDDRRHEAPRLIDQLLKRWKVAGRVESFGPERVAQLAARSWPQNLDQLREAAVRISALFSHSSPAEAAASLDPPISRQALNAYMRRLFGED